MGKKASWNPIEELTDALDDVLSGKIFDIDEKVEKVSHGTEGDTVDVGERRVEPGDGDGTEEVVKPVKSRAKPAKPSKAKGEASGEQESDGADSDTVTE